MCVCGSVCTHAIHMHTYVYLQSQAYSLGLGIGFEGIGVEQSCLGESRTTAGKGLQVKKTKKQTPKTKAKTHRYDNSLPVGKNKYHCHPKHKDSGNIPGAPCLRPSLSPLGSPGTCIQMRPYTRKPHSPMSVASKVSTVPGGPSPGQRTRKAQRRPGEGRDRRDRSPSMFSLSLMCCRLQPCPRG